VMFGAVSPAVMVGGGLWLGVLDWVMGWRSLHWHWSVRLWSRFDISGAVDRAWAKAELGVWMCGSWKLMRLPVAMRAMVCSLIGR
jgi:hypothetical protein